MVSTAITRADHTKEASHPLLLRATSAGISLLSILKKIKSKYSGVTRLSTATTGGIPDGHR